MKAISTDKAPAAVGAYSQAVEAGEFIFCSGQIPINPETNTLVTSGVEDEARQVMSNVAAVLNAADCDFKHVVKASIFLSDMNDFAKVNEIYQGYFSEPFPARACVAVKTLPKNVSVEIEVIAHRS